MVSKINFIPQPLKPVKPVQSTATVAKTKTATFAEILNTQTQKQGEVKLSAHAQKRLAQREIVLGAAEMAKISQALQLADAKGAKDSLLIYGDLALVASVKNKTVITAIDGQKMQEYVFTNIDSAVFIK